MKEVIENKSYRTNLGRRLKNILVSLFKLFKMEKINVANKAQYRIIEDWCEIWEWTRIWNFTHIRDGAKIWKNCNIGNNVYIDIGVIIWDNVKIQNSANLYNWLVVEDDVFIGPSVTFTNDLYPRAFIWWEEKIVPTKVEKWASIGANATIKCWVTIGKYSLVWAGTMVTKDVPPYAIVVWNPGKVVGWVDKSWNRVDEQPKD